MRITADKSWSVTGSNLTECLNSYLLKEYHAHIYKVRSSDQGQLKLCVSGRALGAVQSTDKHANSKGMPPE